MSLAYINLLPSHPANYDFMNSPEALPVIKFPTRAGTMAYIEELIINFDILAGADAYASPAFGGYERITLTVHWPGFSRHRKEFSMDITRGHQHKHIARHVAHDIYHVMDDIIFGDGYMDDGFQGIIRPFRLEDKKRFLLLGLQNTSPGHWIPILATVVAPPS